MYNVRLTQSLFPAQQDATVYDMSVGDMLREIAANNPTSPAVAELNDAGEPGRTLTYSTLLQESEALAMALATRFKKGERVCVWAPNMLTWVLMEYATALAGLVLVTVNPAYQVKELRYVLEQSGACALFLVDGFRGNPMADIAKEACQGLNGLREVVDLEDNQALHATGQQPATLPTVAPLDAAQIQYTSGTTGFPKGATLTHRGLVNNARFFAQRAKTPQHCVWLNFMPLFHTAGCGMAALGCLQAAGKMLLMKQFDPALANLLIEREQITTLLGVPTMLLAILEAAKETPRNTQSLQMITSGGAMVSPKLVLSMKSTFGCEFETVYGQTEASPIITQHHADDSVEDVCHTVGQPLPQTEVSLRSVEENTVVPINTDGEICVRGYCTMLGYHANPEATAETLDKEGWLHTGDLGSMDERGFVSITGRVKEMIIRGGENLFPVEIENTLITHPSVAEVAVVGLPDSKWGEIVACFIRPEEGETLDKEALHQYCRQHISPQKTPTLWCEVSEFPLTGSGKIQKFALRSGFSIGQYKPL